MPNETNEHILSPGQRADLERQPHLTQREAEATMLRIQREIIENDPGLALALWGNGVIV